MSRYKDPLDMTPADGRRLRRTAWEREWDYHLRNFHLGGHHSDFCAECQRLITAQPSEQNKETGS